MKYLAPTLLVLLAAFPLAAAAPDKPAAVHVPFVEGKPWAEVLARAKKEKKPIMLDVVAAWCNPCKWMDRNTFADPKVVAWVASRALPARVDGEKGEGRKIAARYAVNSFPTILFLAPDGSEIDRMLGAHPAGQFERYGEEILSGRGPLARALAELKQSFSLDTAINIVSTLGEHADLARMRPIALRVLSEDPDLTDPRTLGVLAVLASLEDRAGSLSAETADLVETYLPKIGAEPRRGILAVTLAREFVRRGDVEALRKLVAREAAALPQDGSVSDLWASLGEAERKAGALPASEAAYRKALSLLDEQHFNVAVIVVRRLEMAETLAAEKADPKKAAEVRTIIAGAMEKFPSDSGVLARAAGLQLRIGDRAEALRNAKRAVEITKGEDAYSQATLARVLSATGDTKGAQAAWNRAHAIEPENPDYGKPIPKGSAS